MSHNDDIESLVALLAEPYQADPGAIATAVELTLQLPSKSQERLLFRSLERLNRGARPTLIRFLQGIVEAKPALAAVLRRSMKKHGRCPLAARSVISEALGAKTSSSLHRTASEARTILRVPNDSPLGEAGELVLAPETTSFYALPKLFDSIAAVEGVGKGLTVRVRDFVYASGLAIVATWANATAAHRHVNAEDNYTASYLKRIGFYEALDGIEQPVGGDPEDWSVRLTVIGPDARVQDVTARILDILDTFVRPSREDRSSFGILLGELIENVNRHAAAKTPGFVVAQVYPKNYKLGITIADPGIGIRTSFLEGDVAQYRDPVKEDSDFIQLALQPFVTSKQSGHAGYGLFILAELIRRNGGTFGVTSGRQTVVGFRTAGRNQEKIYSHAPWRGTVVTMIVNLQRSLPLGEVYKSLPLPAGYDPADFFQ